MNTTKYLIFSEEDRAAREQLRQARRAMEALGHTEWRKATAGLPWWRRPFVQLEEDQAYWTANAAVLAAMERLQSWKRIFTW